jgi:hypothetical protein
MKDLIFVTAYCPTEEQEIELEKCINSVLECGKHVALISHSHIPIHIQKKCQYYVYDYNNEISNDYNLIGYNYFIFDDYKIESRFFSKSFYGFAIYRMFSIASQLAINFGYEKIHHIEYDCELLDKDLIEQHSRFLEEYDSVIYTHNGRDDGFLFGSFKSFKVSSLPNYFKNYNKDYIDNEMRKIDLKQLEEVTKNLFINSGKVLFLNEPSKGKFKRGRKFLSRNLHFTLFYDPSKKTLNLFYNPKKTSSEEIVVIVNKKHIINLHTQFGRWQITCLGIFDEIDYVRVDNSDKIIYELSFDKEFREIFKLESYITNA